jgi:hypothetical protein
MIATGCAVLMLGMLLLASGVQRHFEEMAKARTVHAEAEARADEKIADAADAAAAATAGKLCAEDQKAGGGLLPGSPQIKARLTGGEECSGGAPEAPAPGREEPGAELDLEEGGSGGEPLRRGESSAPAPMPGAARRPARREGVKGLIVVSI